MTKLKKLLDFVEFTHDIRRVKRAIEFENDIFENDAEHGYQLALACWFLIDYENLKLDRYRTIGMAMVHDIVEVYAGDVITFMSDSERAVQIKKEKEAIKKLKKRWPQFISLHQLIDEYEKLETPESQFVFAMDKLLPAINNYQYGAKTWRKHGITLEKLKETKKGKIELSEVVNQYYQELLKTFEKHPEFFGDASKPS